MYTKFKQRWLEMQAAGSESSDEDEPGAPSKKPGVVPLWKRLNKDGYTPLTLAAKLGEAEMFSFLLGERKITQWSYGPVACVLYPLDQVDLEINNDEVGIRRGNALVGRHHRLVLSLQNTESSVSALEIIVQVGHVELIMHPRLIDLVNKKWERFARQIFFHRFLVTLSYLIIFLGTTILDQSRTEIVSTCSTLSLTGMHVRS